MAAKKIRVLVVDDAAMIREMISDYLNEAPDIEVVGVAKNGKQAIEKARALKPDVVTLDVQMPEMDGLATLKKLLETQPLPVIMVSALTQLGANTTLESLECGAMDYITKPQRGADAAATLRDELSRKIRAVVGIDVERILRIRKERGQRAPVRPVAPPPASVTDVPPQYADKCIVLGISTGGPPALTTLFTGLRTPLPPIVIVQHMPEQFTKPFAWRLNSLSPISVKEAESGDVILPNHAYVAPGGRHFGLRKQGAAVHALVRDGENVSGHKPSADYLMKSVVEIYGGRCLGVIMTGMGRDGADGCKMIRVAGGYVLGQDEETSDVYGMNKVAFVEGNVDRQFSLENAAATIMKQAQRMWGRTTVAS